MKTLKWVKRTDQEPDEPFMAMGWSNHLLLWSKKEKVWFEGVYNFDDQKFYTLDHTEIDEYISHFCETVPGP